MIRRAVPITEVLLPQLIAHLALPIDEEMAHRVFDISDPKKAVASSCVLVLGSITNTLYDEDKFENEEMSSLIIQHPTSV